jgi:predicted ATPase
LLSHISIKGFKKLSNVQLPLRPLNVVIGANGCGKTSLLDAINLLAASAQGKLADSLSSHWGLTNLLTRGKAGSLDFEAAVTFGGQANFDYLLRIAPFGNGHRIEMESLYSTPNGPNAGIGYLSSIPSRTTYWNALEGRVLEAGPEHMVAESALSQVPSMVSEAFHIKLNLGSIGHYKPIDVSPRAPVRLPQPISPVLLPNPTGEDFAACLHNLKESYPDNYENIESMLRSAFPWFQRLAFPAVAAGTVMLRWDEQGSGGGFYINQLSDGTVRFLWLMTILHSPHLPSLLLVDEPEISLHPEMLALLADALREASTRCQVVVATHSDRLVGFLRPEEVLVCNQGEEGATELTWADSLDLEHWLSEYSMDALWRMGVIGGRG